MSPIRVAPVQSRVGRSGLFLVTLKPVADNIMIKLFGPKKARESLAHYVLCVDRQGIWNDRAVKLIRFFYSKIEDIFKRASKDGAHRRLVGEAQFDRGRSAWRQH